MLKKFKMEDSNSVGTPMECRFKLSKHEEGNKMDPTLYKCLVGSLPYLTCTGPNILYVVGVVRQYVENLTTTHLKAEKRIFYIKGTIKFSLCYSMSNDYKLAGYNDGN